MLATLVQWSGTPPIMSCSQRPLSHRKTPQTDILLRLPALPPRTMADPSQKKNKMSHSATVESGSLSAPPSETLFAYVNLDEAIPEIVCTLCMMPLVDPCDMPCCDNYFCRHCLDVLANNRCPHCPDKHFPEGGAASLPKCTDKVALKRLDALRVTCPQRAGGCDWTGPRGNIEEHMTRTCDHQLCPNGSRGCAWRGRMRDNSAHVTQACEFENLSCPRADTGCSFVGLRGIMLAHTVDPAQCSVLRHQQAVERKAQAERKEAEKRRRHDELVRARLALFDQLNPPEWDMMKLDVRGRLFTVGRLTLCKYDDSVLAQLLLSANRERELQTTGIERAVILDVDADAFAAIVGWLTMGAVPECVSDKAMLLHHARLFALHALVEELGGEPDEAVAAEERPATRQHQQQHMKRPRITQAHMLEAMQISNCASGGRLALI